MSMQVTYPTPSSECATLTSKGQVTVPVAVRESLGLKQGDRVLFVMDSTGAYTIRPQRDSHHSVAGMLSGYVHKPYSKEDFRGAMVDHLRHKFGL